MGPSNNGRKKIKRLNEHNRMPIILIGGRMKVFNTISHILKSNRSSNLWRDGGDDGNRVTFVVDIVVELKLDMI